MYESTAILLGKPTATYDDYGNEILSHAKKQVFCKMRSVYQSEFYNAAQLGIQASIVLIISNRIDYENEKEVFFNGTYYDVVRADWANEGDSVSLTLAERIVNNGRNECPAPTEESS